MTETLSFPGLGLSFELSRVAFWLGNFPIYWYGLAFAAAFLLGLAYFHYGARRVGIHPYEGLDALLWAIIGGVIGARVYFVIFQWDAMYKANPIKIFAFREGGLAIYGGVIGAILVGAIACKFKKIPMLPMLDVGLPALLLGQAIGRWGNFFNIEAFGGNTTLPWGMTAKTVEQYLSRPDVMEGLAKLGQTANPYLPVHPTFFYEFLWNLLGFLLLALVLTPRRRYDGQVALGYAAWYGLGRTFIEGLRTDSLVAQTPWGMIRVSQYLAAIGFVLSLVLLLVLAKKARGENRPSWLRLYAGTPDSAALLAKGDAAVASSGKKKGNAVQEDTLSTQSAEPETEGIVSGTEDVVGVMEDSTDPVDIAPSAPELEVPEEAAVTDEAETTDKTESDDDNGGAKANGENH